GRGESDEAGQVAAFPPNFVDCIVLDRLLWSLSSPGRAQGEPVVGRAGGPGGALSPRQILWRPRKQQTTRGWGRGQSHKRGRRQGVRGEAAGRRSETETERSGVGHSQRRLEPALAQRSCDRGGDPWRSAPGAPFSPRTETGLAVPPDFKASPLSAFDVADLDCSPFGLLSVGAVDSEGSSLPGWLRFAIVGAMLFLATPLQRWPDGPLMALRSRGAALPAFTALRRFSPVAAPPATPQPDTRHPPHVGSLSDPSCTPQSAQ
ncbi:MAG: hypothetical protein ACI8RZ_005502, partial [Myxococcota bacterium]